MADFKRVVNVIPLTRVKLTSSQLFTYLVPLKLQGQIRPGQLVRAPFGARTVTGVVSSFEMHRLDAETRSLKSLAQLVDPAPVLSEKNLALANWLSGYCVCPLGMAVKVMLPNFGGRPKEPQILGYERYDPDFVLNEFQRQAVSQIGAALGKPATFLLYGQHGSGKTEVYMQIIKRLISSGKQVIMLVPEISLAASAIEKFARRFGIENIGLYHSGLRRSERLHTWQKIREGKKSLVIGARSAIFAPVSNLGLVIIDEEHDPSFKQYDQHPKYHTAAVARKLAELWSCPLLLGDATPSMESYFEARRASRALLTLPHRIKADVGQPRVKVVDMKTESTGGTLSEFLKHSILQALHQKRQIILFVNRRGSATFMMCRDCSYVPACEDCTVGLTWHKNEGGLVCHHCGRNYPMYTVCPKCAGPHIKYFGIGTQGVEEELKEFLTSTASGKRAMPRIERVDSDSTTKSKELEKTKADILIGTQIISKKWHAKPVGLVGIISADAMLNLPDFRASERAFQVLTGVIGAASGKISGLVVLQTWKPENYVIEAAARHDYEKFFLAEMRERRRFCYPPVTRLVKLTVAGASAQDTRILAQNVLERLKAASPPAVQITGPAPAFIPKVRGKYREHIVLKLPKDREIDLYHLLKNLPTAVDIDVDPESLL